MLHKKTHGIGMSSRQINKDSVEIKKKRDELNIKKQKKMDKTEKQRLKLIGQKN